MNKFLIIYCYQTNNKTEKDFYISQAITNHAARAIAKQQINVLLALRFKQKVYFWIKRVQKL